MVFWSLSIIASVVCLVLSAATRDAGVHMAYAHMAIAAAVSLSFALIYIREHETLRMARAKPAALAACTARFCGIVWTWGAMALAVTYGTGILYWREWLTFLAACAVLAVLCMGFSALLSKDVAQDREDETMLRLARYLTIAQFVAMLLTMVGLVVDGKMTRFMTLRYTDWAANNIFFFGALAIAAICGYALTAKPQSASTSAKAAAK